MDKWNIEIILAYVEYDKSAEIVDGELPVQKIVEVESTDYPSFVKLGGWRNGEKLYVQPYLNTKVEENNENVDIAIKMNVDIAEQIADVRIGVGFQKHSPNTSGNHK